MVTALSLGSGQRRLVERQSGVAFPARDKPLVVVDFPAPPHFFAYRLTRSNSPYVRRAVCASRLCPTHALFGNFSSFRFLTPLSHSLPRRRRLRRLDHHTRRHPIWHGCAVDHLR